MNRLLYITLFAVVVLVGDHVSAEDKVPQIKMKRVQLWYANRKYNDELSYSISRKNATYNNINVRWVVAKDLPADIVTAYKVYATDSEYKTSKLLLKGNTPVCRDSPTQELLPAIVAFDKPQLRGSCVKKGVHDAEDVGNFRFEILLPNLREISDYYYVDYKLGNRKETVLKVTFYSEWGYLNDSE